MYKDYVNKLIIINQNKIYLLEKKLRQVKKEMQEIKYKIENETILDPEESLGLEEALTLISTNDIFYNKDYIIPSILFSDIQNENPNIVLSNYEKSKLREQLGYYGSFYRGRLNNKIYRIYFKNKYETSQEMQEIINKYKKMQVIVNKYKEWK